ncbi:PhzF family phenazine biosynthesis protein [Vibrio sp. SCSIO 43136]|uniref:PhzF family phenazine biosynthesis protein n=1 Tax=Vibrio sp. SCSIO 43136 TaxID=2819101 RepID=UPI002074EF7B|nr:PhzF family phenazine biosynthesis protein [Vibrio sp. SCSIO 43136]USD66760.1 PhzF family phenazine biosynthesis protein [Vibrio sp. SCSIO 43136]
MKLDIYIVDAFTDTQFKGNSAAVVPVEEWLAEEVMQSIAIENNLSETAFIKPVAPNHYQIRWFSPLTEVDFCGHATLATSYVLFEVIGLKGTIQYSTEHVGDLFVKQGMDRKIEMSFPVRPPLPVSHVPQDLLDGLSIEPVKVLKSPQAYFAVLQNHQQVLEVQYDSEKLKLLAPFDVVVTAKSDEYDFISRYFWPANGGDEDPVTGSIHAGLAPYWSEQLGKESLVAFQASQRGGKLYCEIAEDRVLVSGHAVLYLQGSIEI